jgi:hypothetical protein
VQGCTILPHVTVNGRSNVAGNVVWAIYKLSSNSFKRLYGETSPVEGHFIAGEETGGTYRFTARFLGNGKLPASRHKAVVIFHVEEEC